MNSTFVTTANEVVGISLLAEHDSGLVSVRLVGNIVDLHANPGGGSGIRWGTQGDGDGRLDVLNTVRPREPAGALGELEPGRIRSMGPEPRTSMSPEVRSTDPKGPGVFVSSRVDAPGQVRVAVFGTIVSNAKAPAIALQALHPATLVYRGGFNDIFGSDASHLGGRPAGAGNLKLDPRYVDGASGDLRLRGSSPLIDRGVVCSPAGVANLDAAGTPGCLVRPSTSVPRARSREADRRGRGGRLGRQRPGRHRWRRHPVRHGRR